MITQQKTPERFAILQEVEKDQPTVLDIKSKKRGERFVVDFMPIRKNKARDLAKLAPEIARKYTVDLMSYRELAEEYNATLPTIRQLLKNHKVELRERGRIAGKASPAHDQAHQKLTQEDIFLILKLDKAGTPHTVIQSHLDGKITRERVRQICLEAGHMPRAILRKAANTKAALQKQAETIQQAIQKSESTLLPDDRVTAAARLYREHQPFNTIAQALQITPEHCAVLISRWRSRWPTLFPLRHRPQPEAKPKGRRQPVGAK